MSISRFMVDFFGKGLGWFLLDVVCVVGLYCCRGDFVLDCINVFVRCIVI